MAGLARWVKPEVVPLVGMMSVALSFLTYTCGRSFSTAPEVLLSKKKRMEGGASLTEAQGQVYKHSPLRETVRRFYDFESTSNPLTPVGKH